MKKIIPIFGSQELFDGADDDIEFAVEYCESERASNGCRSVHFIKEIKRALEFVQSVHVTAISHRRIEEVPEPKRWTVEDQKAGRLPEVGSQFIVNGDCFINPTNDRNLIVTARYYRDDQCCVETKSGFLEIIPNIKPSFLTPIETPDEKAARLEDEFVESLMRDEYEPSMSDEAKEWAIHGIKCAYRKLYSGTTTKDGE